MSKRGKGYPSETRVKRGERIVHGDKDLSEKLGRNDPCPCGSGHSFQALLPEDPALRRSQPRLLFLDEAISVTEHIRALAFSPVFGVAPVVA